MLRGNYPADLYMPYREGAYDFCLRCHNKNLLSAGDATTATGFRNGSRNLHVVHVANKLKGRTCRVCHEPHASDGEKLISKEGTKFGTWKIPLNFKITPTGGAVHPAVTGCSGMTGKNRKSIDENRNSQHKRRRSNGNK